jgi:hypothetical protein
MGLDSTTGLGFRSFVLECLPKHITLLRLEFSDLFIYQYNSLSEVMIDLAKANDIKYTLSDGAHHLYKQKFNKHNIVIHK